MLNIKKIIYILKNTKRYYQRYFFGTSRINKKVQEKGAKARAKASQTRFQRHPQATIGPIPQAV